MSTTLTLLTEIIIDGILYGVVYWYTAADLVVVSDALSWAFHIDDLHQLGIALQECDELPVGIYVDGPRDLLPRLYNYYQNVPNAEQAWQEQRLVQPGLSRYNYFVGRQMAVSLPRTFNPNPQTLFLFVGGQWAPFTNYWNN